MHLERLAFVGLFEFFGGGVGGDPEEVVVGFIFGGGGEEGTAAAEEEGDVETHFSLALSGLLRRVFWPQTRWCLGWLTYLFGHYNGTRVFVLLCF